MNVLGFLSWAQVHEEFKQNVENIGIDNLIQKFAEQKGTGKERPGAARFTASPTATIAHLQQMFNIKKVQTLTLRTTA